jgi:hypothetical protein
LVDERQVADLSTFEKYDECGLDPRIAVGPHGSSERLADELRDAGFRGVLSPSAALPGAINLSIFGERYEHVTVGDLSSWRNPDPGCWVPVQAVAEMTGPPAELTLETCFLNAPHYGYREWLADRGRPLPADPP